MKRSLEELTITGAPPAFDHPLHVGRPNFGDREAFNRRMDDMFNRAWLTNCGPFVEEFEARIAAVAGVRNVVATCNATIALELLMAALGLTGSVILPAFTFIASAHAVRRQGLVPLFCDADPVTHNIDPDEVEALIRPDTSAILGVHLWGRGCDAASLQDIADRHGLQLIFDAAQAFGSTIDGRPVGGFGRGEVFSFHATKAINSFEGGAVATDDDELAARLRLMINFGFSDYDTVESWGTNGKMSEPCAAMGLTSLESMDAIFAHNRANHNRYRQCLDGIPGLRLVDFPAAEKASRHYVVVEVDEAALGAGRDVLQTVLVAENVLARRYFYPGCHRSEPYRSDPVALPVTDRLCSGVLCLPTGTQLGTREIEQICAIIGIIANNARYLARRLEQ